MRARALPMVVAALLASTNLALASTAEHEPRSVSARGTPALPKRLISLSAAELRQFARDSVRWEERTKTWQNHETATRLDAPSRITRLWAVTEVDVIRMTDNQLRDRKPRIVSMFGNDGPFATHGMAPGDTMYLVLEMDEKTDGVNAFSVVVSGRTGNIHVFSVGQPQVCNAWTPAPTEISNPAFINPRSCTGSHDEAHSSPDSPADSRLFDRGAPEGATNDSGETGSSTSTRSQAEVESVVAVSHTGNLGARGGLMNCVPWFTCGRGGCVVRFPDGKQTGREMR